MKGAREHAQPEQSCRPEPIERRNADDAVAGEGKRSLWTMQLRARVNDNEAADSEEHVHACGSDVLKPAEPVNQSWGMVVCRDLATDVMKDDARGRDRPYDLQQEERTAILLDRF